MGIADDEIHPRKDFDITVPQVVREGSDIGILFHGSISNDVMDAYNKLSKENIYPMLVSVPVIQPLNKECLFAVLKGMKYVVFVEEHFENTGIGSILMRFYCEYKPCWKIKTMGIPYRFIHEIKDTVNMRRLFGISSEGIVKVVKDMLEV